MVQPIVASDRKGFRAFIERHDQLFTMLGALIVFIGFYTKEIVLEKASDLSSSLKSTRNNYEINQRLTNMSDRLDAAKLSLVQFESNGPNASPLHDSFETISETSQAYDVSYDDFMLTEQLLKSLPFQSDSLNKTASDLHRSIAILNPEQAKMLELRGTVDLGRIRTVNQVRNHPAYSDMMASASAFVVTSTHFNKSVATFKNDVNAEGNAQLQRLETRSSKATNWSYFLFALGWALGLASKILKLPALGDA